MTAWNKMAGEITQLVHSTSQCFFWEVFACFDEINEIVYCLQWGS